MNTRWTESIAYVALCRAMITTFNWSLILLIVSTWIFDGNITAYASSVHNDLELRTDMSEEDQRAFNAVLEKIKREVVAGRVTTTNSEDAKKLEKLKNSIADLEQVKLDKEEAQRKVNIQQNKMNYLIIDRNVNNEIMREVMKSHPELKTKQEASRWMKSHKKEVDQIANKVIAN